MSIVLFILLALDNIYFSGDCASMQQEDNYELAILRKDVL